MSPAAKPRVALLIVCLACTAAAAPALGVRASGELLTQADASLAWVPAADFSHELDRLAPPGGAAFHAVVPARGVSKVQQSAAVERKELEEALSDVSPADRAAVLAAYADARKAVGSLEGVNPDHLRPGTEPVEVPSAVPPAAVPTPTGSRPGVWDILLRLGNLLGPGAPGVLNLRLPVPPGFPDEFAEHLGALADYYAGNTAVARARWQRLLDRPPEQRRRRTVWATFMIGKTWLDELPHDGEEEPGRHAAEWFRRTRDRVGEGFPDPLGLAAASLGWEARAELRHGELHRAVALYLQAHAAGDPAADESLALICRDWFAQKHKADDWADQVKDPATRDVVTVYAMAQGTEHIGRPDPASARGWLSAVRLAGADGAAGLSRLALIALQNDDATEAARLLAAAPADDPLALWLRGKRAAAAGDLAGAADLLARAADGFAPDEVWHNVRGGGYVTTAVGMERALCVRDRVRAELGVVELARGSYVLATDLLLRSGWATDAAYVAECVATPEELIDYARRTWPEYAVGVQLAGTSEWEVACAGTRDQVARRLVRLGRWKEAREWFTPGRRATLDAYVTAIREGHDADRSDDDRADSFWKAALLARGRGPELFGHDTTPGTGPAARRTGDFTWLQWTIVGGRLHPQSGKFLNASADEVRRATAAVPRHFSRWDARVVASEHAWSAAALMPDESDETARRLCLAGNWLKDEDAEAARRFYRALIDRCGTTKLGREAVRIEWLPAAW